MFIVIIATFVTAAVTAIAFVALKKAKDLPPSALGLLSLIAVPLFLVWQWQLPNLAWIAWLSLAQIVWLSVRSAITTGRDLRARKVGVTTF